MTNRTTRAVLVALGLLVASTSIPSSPAFAVVPTSTSAVNTDEQGIAMHGYDPVAYFTVGAPTKGNPTLTFKYKGASYFFASAENLKKFKANPAAFAPQFGGFCAMGVALEKKLDGDPAVWKIVDGKLYLNVNADVAVAWQRDIPGNLEKAKEYWPGIKGKTPESLN
ncbi:YHS domain-containing (seleno)protein [Sphingorhabdus lacus]|uniref:YHS domain-containing protein n=1 Tax=Sphingorhabdus lacus TaxID=392610 RepID=A0A6I6LD48_9SPHN|nr:YHS domain-containing (seleno)protein [Sphingorhabdus lacus]QGY81987.1 YHS domain-containing protein [Sphingorhabdus lacus]